MGRDDILNLAATGLAAPFIGLVVSTLLEVINAVPIYSDMMNILVWVTILIIEMVSIVDDFESLLINGPVFSFCFTFSLCLINGVNLGGTFIMATFIALICSLISF